MIRKKEFSIEVLRLFACFLVVLYHSRYAVYEYLSAGGSISQFDSICLNVGFVIGRIAVPIFFMISGYFSFPVKSNTFSFLKKRMSRIVFPLFFWLVVYTLCFSKPDNMLFDFFNAVHASHLWFLYALIGLTLLIPLISNFVYNATKKELLLYIAIWGLTLIFNGNFFDGFLIIETDHKGLLFSNPIAALLNFYGYFRYLLLGYYLKKYSCNRRIPYILFFIASILVVIQYFIFKIPIGNIMAYCSLANVLVSSSIFIICKEFFDFYEVNDRIYNGICEMGNLTFGIYLIHCLIFRVLYVRPEIASWNCIITSIIAFGISAIITYILSQVSFKKYIIG